jgi:hypothetical protein
MTSATPSVLFSAAWLTEHLQGIRLASQSPKIIGAVNREQRKVLRSPRSVTVAKGTAAFLKVAGTEYGNNHKIIVSGESLSVVFG